MHGLLCCCVQFTVVAFTWHPTAQANSALEDPRDLFECCPQLLLVRLQHAGCHRQAVPRVQVGDGERCPRPKALLVKHGLI